MRRRRRRLHANPPTSLLHVSERKEGDQRHRPDFMAFHRCSTAMFNGSMSCDCSRERLKFPELVDSLIESRCYRHPTRLFRASFIQLFGDLPLLSRAHLDLLNASNDLPANARVAEVDHKLDTFYFKKTSLLSFARNVAPAMVPRPTHFILNVDIWDFRKLLKDLPLVVQARRHCILIVCTHALCNTRSGTAHCSLYRGSLKRLRCARAVGYTRASSFLLRLWWLDTLLFTIFECVYESINPNAVL
jgi:hypothetical protein